MSEHQHIEWKSVWKDEYIRWISGFANAQGGTLEIGKDDKGQVIGIQNAQKLLETLPNKIRDILGIIADVNLHNEAGKDWISIEVKPHPHPVSYKGQYYYRSGSTKQELKGAALNRFLLQKQGKRWDSVPLPYVSADELSADAFAYLKKRGIQTKRLDEDVFNESPQTLLDKLRLSENEYLTRAAALLFHPDPEKFVTGAYVKIGYFRSETDLRFQDEIHGYLFEQVEKTMDLLLSKYSEAQVRYEGIARVEEYFYPEAALREAVLNAIAHKDYSGGNPIQIKVYENRIMIWNAGQLPEKWTVDTLLKEHSSVPFNPHIANTFFRAGLIEAWGQGTLKIMKECKAAGVPAPSFSSDAVGFRIEFRAGEKKKMEGTSGKGSVKSSEKSSEKGSVKSSEKIIEQIREDSTVTTFQLADELGISTRAVEKHLARLKKQNKIRRVGPAKGGHWEIVEQV